MCAIPILLKLYRYFDHALKMCILFKCNPLIYFDTFFFVFRFELRHFDNESEWAVGILCKQLPLQFYSDSFEI